MYTEFTNYLPSLGREGLNEMYDDVRKQLELEKKLRKVRVINILVHTQKSRIDLVTSRQQVVFALLVTSCQQFWNNLLTTCKDIAEIIRLVTRLF
jgi:hypothetical protein